jgi:hypothetical protein
MVGEPSRPPAILRRMENGEQGIKLVVAKGL